MRDDKEKPLLCLHLEGLENSGDLSQQLVTKTSD